MRFACIFTLSIYFPIHDLISAFIYDGGSFPQIEYLRYFRDLSVITIASLALAKVRLPSDILNPISLYVALVLLYSVVGVIRGMPISVVVGSLGTLFIPILLFLVGYFCILDTYKLLVIAKLFLVLGFLTVLFGIYDVNNTNFWVEDISFGLYHLDIKGTESGLHPNTLLPWNFHSGVFDSRRAGGLLASPLAQGHFLAVAAPISLMFYMRGQNPLYLVLMSFFLFGIWQSGTRGAMLIALIALAGMSFTSESVSRTPVIRWGITFVLLALAYIPLETIITTTIGLSDGSSPGHWRALIANLQGLPSILVFGYGVGFQGAVAATILSLRSLLEGGGEGAIFSIAFQIGLPGALAFIYFYWRCWKRLSISIPVSADLPYINMLIKWLIIGFSSSFVLSEIILSFSGSAAFWLLLGGTLRLNSGVAFESKLVQFNSSHYTKP